MAGRKKKDGPNPDFNPQDDSGYTAQNQIFDYRDDQPVYSRDRLQGPPIVQRPIININFDNFPKLPGIVWFFILAVAGLWGGWFVWVANLFPVASFPVEVLLWTLGTVFFMFGLVKSEILWGLKLWILTAALIGVFAVIRYYAPQFDFGTIVAITGGIGGFFGFWTIVIELEFDS